MRSCVLRWPSAVLVAAAACWFPSCTGERPPNVVVVVLDTARPDALSVYGDPRPTSPFLEEFARTGTTFERAYASSSWTLPSHATLFTGALPTVHHATQTHPRMEESVPTLAEQLAAKGYTTGGFSNNPWVAEHTGLARGFQHFVDQWETRDRANDDPEVHPTVKAVHQWLGGAASGTAPFFLFVNLIEPHMPYLPPPGAAKPFFASAEAVGATANAFFKRGEPHGVVARHYAGKEALTESEWESLRALYAGELRFTDALVRSIVTAAEARGGAERTLVFLVSDHGENFGEHGHIGHCFNLYDSNVRIAMLARGPGIARDVREPKLAQIADVYATALAAAELTPAKHCVGYDLREPLPNARVVYAALDRPTITIDAFPKELRDTGVLARWDRELEAVIGPRWKLIRASDGTEELFDLLADPEERRPLAITDETSAFVTSARTILQTVRDSASAAGGAALTSDPGVLAALKALGYAQ